jgi:hypothetical protein
MTIHFKLYKEKDMTSHISIIYRACPESQTLDGMSGCHIDKTTVIIAHLSFVDKHTYIHTYISTSWSKVLLGKLSSEVP